MDDIQKGDTVLKQVTGFAGGRLQSRWERGEVLDADADKQVAYVRWVHGVTEFCRFAELTQVSTLGRIRFYEDDSLPPGKACMAALR